jgi:hypothetical protein
VADLARLDAERLGDLDLGRAVEQHPDERAGVGVELREALLEHRVRDGRHQAVPAVDHAHGVEQLARRDALVEQPVGVGERGGQRERRARVCGEDDDLGRGHLLLDPVAELQPVAARQVVVEQHDVGARPVEQRPDALLLAVALAREDDARLRLQDGVQARAQRGMVIDDDDADHGEPPFSLMGTSSSITVPRPSGPALT